MRSDLRRLIKVTPTHMTRLDDKARSISQVFKCHEMKYLLNWVHSTDSSMVSSRKVKLGAVDWSNEIQIRRGLIEDHSKHSRLNSNQRKLLISYPSNIKRHNTYETRFIRRFIRNSNAVVIILNSIANTAWDRIKSITLEAHQTFSTIIASVTITST